MDKILIIEDADTLREVLGAILENEGYQVKTFASGEEALSSVEQEIYSLVICDFKLPKMNGLEFLSKLREKDATTPFVLITAFGSVDIAVQAMKLGATDFISKPFEPSHISSVVRDLIQHRRIINRDIGIETRRHRKILTRNKQMAQIMSQAARVARVDSAILIHGESGTGKELLARFVHEHSPRKDKPFVGINCAAMPADLLESEFFGHEMGAFTGATQTRIGLFEVASEGTIFLDEIADMPTALQVKLLRVLQEREIRRVGSTRTIKVNPRIISATNSNIEEALNSGRLREDLYYRLAVVSFETLPLRRRQDDIELLSDFFIDFFSSALGKPKMALSDAARNLLMSYPWPGNVRELENIIERAVIMGTQVIMPQDLGFASNLNLDLSSIEEATTTLPLVAERASRKAEIDLINKILATTQGNKSKAAEMLGVSYKTLLNKVKEYGLGGNQTL